MDLHISVLTDDDRELVSLYRWLAQDASVQRNARISRGTFPPPPGSTQSPMGDAFDFINAVLSNANAVAGIGSMLIAYKAWRGTRSKPPAITIRHGDITVTVAEGSEQEIQPLLNALTAVPVPEETPDEEDTGGR
jgi:hypothetical protein